MVQESFNQRFRTMFKDSRIPLEQRRYLLMSILFSGIIHGSSTWTELIQATEADIHATIMRAYRLLFPDKYTNIEEQKTSNLGILFKTNMPSPSN